MRPLSTLSGGEMKRIPIDVSDEMHAQLKFIPVNLRSEVLRSLIAVMIRTQMSNVNRYVPEDIINDRLMLVRKDQVHPDLLAMFEQEKANE